MSNEFVRGVGAGNGGICGTGERWVNGKVMRTSTWRDVGVSWSAMYNCPDRTCSTVICNVIEDAGSGYEVREDSAAL